VGPQEEDALPVKKAGTLPGLFTVFMGYRGQETVDDLGGFGGGEGFFAHL
jgi:hypothetical protein